MRSVDHYELRARRLMCTFLKRVARIEVFTKLIFKLDDLVVFMQQKFRARSLFKESKL